jgi:hypothetical protein
MGMQRDFYEVYKKIKFYNHSVSKSIISACSVLVLASNSFKNFFGIGFYIIILIALLEKN